MEGAKCFMTLAALVCLAAPLTLAQTTIDAAYLQGRVQELPEKRPGKLDVSDKEILQFKWDKGSWKVLYSEIKTVYVSLSRRSVMMEAFGIYAAPVAAGKKRKLLLSLVVNDKPGANRNCVFYLPGGANREFIRALETGTGRNVIFESEEARVGAEGK